MPMGDAVPLGTGMKGWNNVYMGGKCHCSMMNPRTKGSQAE